MSPWYGGYAFQGVVVLGTAPILLPLIVGDATGPAQAGLVVAALYIGQLTAPMFGALADGSGRHRLIYAAGYLLLAVGLGLFPLAQTVLEWFILALMQGLGVAATNTVASMFIVEFRPKAEWDRRIGWMQTCYGIGQAAGLGLAALLQQAPAWGMLASAALMLPGLLIGLLGTPRGRRAGLGAAAATAQTPKRGASISDDATSRRHAPPRQILPHGHIGPATGALLGRFLADLRSPYALFMLCWLLVMLGTWLIYNLYPLLMQSVSRFFFSGRWKCAATRCAGKLKTQANRCCHSGSGWRPSIQGDHTRVFGASLRAALRRDTDHAHRPVGPAFQPREWTPASRGVGTTQAGQGFRSASDPSSPPVAALICRPSQPNRSVARVQAPWPPTRRDVGDLSHR